MCTASSKASTTCNGRCEEKGDDKKQDNDEKKAKLARAPFLPSAAGQAKTDFIEFFAGTLCSVGQHVGKEGYADLSRALYQDNGTRPHPDHTRPCGQQLKKKHTQEKNNGRKNHKNKQPVRNHPDEYGAERQLPRRKQRKTAPSCKRSPAADGSMC
jgi:hypothetical protein